MTCDDGSHDSTPRSCSAFVASVEGKAQCSFRLAHEYSTFSCVSGTALTEVPVVDAEVDRITHTRWLASCAATLLAYCVRTAANVSSTS